MKSEKYRVLGDPSVKKEFTEAHCRRLAKWFDAKGRFVHYGTAPSSRELLWNCFSLMGHGADRYKRLAEAIILKTPIDENHFTPFAAVELMLRFKDRLNPAAYAYLKKIVEAHLINSLEVRFGGEQTHNFSCMTTWFLLAASQVLDFYDFKHPLASIPEVYTGLRIRAMGMNSLRLLAWHSEHEKVFREFNSPTYSPISLHSLAKIVELDPHEEAREMALKIEMKLWREILALYHPDLGVQCGPFSRAYRVDILGQNSQMRILFCYLGLSCDRSIVRLFDEKRKGVIFHHDGDIPFTWSGPAWQMANRFHVPADALDEMRRRSYPKRFQAQIRWGEFGYIDPVKKKYISVQGSLLPAGETKIFQVQKPGYALGWREESTFSHSFPILCHYALKPKVASMEDVRHVTAATVLFGAPEEWVKDQRGRPMEASNFNNAGRVIVRERGGGLRFKASPFAEFAPLSADEISINTFFPVHFSAPEKVAINGTPYSGTPVILRGKEAVCRVEEAGFFCEVRYKFPNPVEFRLWRWANFIRFAGFWYQGPAREFSPSFLGSCAMDGEFVSGKM